MLNTSDPLINEEAIRIHKSNFRNVQIDAIGVGLAGASGTFLPVFLTRLGASNIQVGLLTTMPGITGLLLAILVGRFLQTRRNIIPWFSAARLMVISCYALTGLLTIIVPPSAKVPSVLAIWAFATLPQTIVAVAFTVVMNAVAGPQGRYELLSRRWTTLGLTNAITVTLAGLILDRIEPPLNYQIVFLALSLGGLISFYFSSHIKLLDVEPPKQLIGGSIKQNVNNYKELIRGEPAFISFALKRFVLLSGIALSAPIFPLYYVREIHAPDSWIGIFSTTQTFVMLVGYFVWTRLSRRRGSRFVLLCTTLGISLHPLLTASTHHVELIAVFAGIAGIFQSGLDLVLFDELMKTVPVEYSATFVSLAQSMQYLSTIASPLIGTYLSNHIGLGGALMVSSAIRFSGFLLFFLHQARRKQNLPDAV
jgi:MFS family permease